MTAWEAIRWVDEKKHNVYSAEDKLLWLNQAEKMVSQLRQRCALSPAAEVEGDGELAAPAPFDQLYLRWLEAQIDYANQEFLKYNNAMTMFTTLWQEYANFLRRGAVGSGGWKFF